MPVTLTNLYNQRPTWLDLAHRKLDAAVFDAYGWSHDLSDEEILERLLALNMERVGAVAERCGMPGWRDIATGIPANHQLGRLALGSGTANE